SHIGHDTEIDRAFTAVDACLLDNLTRTVDAAEERGNKGDEENPYEDVDAASGHNEVLQGLIDGSGSDSAVLLQNILSACLLGIIFPIEEVLDLVAIHGLTAKCSTQADIPGRIILTHLRAHVYACCALDDMLRGKYIRAHFKIDQQNQQYSDEGCLHEQEHEIGRV